MSTVFEIGSEYDWDSNIAYTTENAIDIFGKINPGNIKLLRSGRDALRYIARAYKKNMATVLMPSLCCSCMPEPFADEGFSVVYYKLNDDYSVNIQDVRSKIKPNSFFLYMNYFAIPAMNRAELQCVRSAANHVITIEDITHEFMNRNPDSFIADFTVCSIRKWLAIPDGGMLISKKALPFVNTEENDYFAIHRISAMKTKSKYLNFGDSELKATFRKDLGKTTEYIDSDKTIVNINHDSLQIMTHFDVAKAYTQRKSNATVMYQTLKDVPGIHVLDRNSVNSTLYFPILVENQAGVQQILAQNGVYAPVIWPLPDGADTVCEVADETAKHMLAIPCDHRYSSETINSVIEIVKNAVAASARG